MSAASINQVTYVNITDSDLVELADYHAYQYIPINKSIDVNEKTFLVWDVLYKTDSGLDALTVKNKETNEITVVFVGSDQLTEDWLLTNTKLVGDVPPNS